MSSPSAPAVPLPQFRQPLQPDPPVTSPSPTDPTSPAAPSPTSPDSPPPSPLLLGRPGREQPKPAATTPSASSSASEQPDLVKRPAVKDAAVVIVGILGLVVGAAALGVRWRGQRELRRPTAQQLEDVAQPLARIAHRHADASWLNLDLLDILAAGNAIGAYITEAPLTVQLTPDAGVPADLQENY
jgi:hypothetical protein